MRQDVFDKGAIGILTQGRKSIDRATAICMYTDRRGGHCAIGWNIPFNHPVHHRKGNVEDIVTDFPDLREILLEKEFSGFAYLSPEVRELRQFQNLHDGGSPTSWIKNLRLFAEEHDLVFNEAWLDLGAGI